MGQWEEELEEGRKVDSKACTQCKQLLPFTAFSRNSTSPDGHQWQCRACYAAYRRNVLQAKDNGNAHALDHDAEAERLAAFLLAHPLVIMRLASEMMTHDEQTIAARHIERHIYTMPGPRGFGRG
jgi:hypothetical protein